MRLVGFRFLVPIVALTCVILSPFAAAQVVKDEYIILLKDFASQSNTDVVVKESVEKVSVRLLAKARTHQMNKLSHSSQKATADNKRKRVYDGAFRGFSAKLSPSAVELLRSDPDIELVVPNVQMKINGTQNNTPSWGLDRVDQRVRQADDTYRYGAEGLGVHAYVMDSGIWGTHNEFTGRVADGFDALGDNLEATDCDGHGTHVAGTIAGTNVGIAKSVVVHPVRVIGCSGIGSFNDTVAGVEWILNNIQLPAVVNVSFGVNLTELSDSERADVVATWNFLIGLLNAFGATVVVSAGNENIDACDYAPANNDDVITVAASTSNDLRRNDSNFGSCVDIFAPGDDILSAWRGSNSAAAPLGGTSMATPHVAGVVALYLEKHPDATPVQVSDAIIESATEGLIQNAGTGSPNRLLFSAILSQDFEQGFTWSNNGTIDWTTISGGTRSNYTGPSVAADGTATYAYLEASGVSSNNTVKLESPLFDAGGNIYVSFYYHMFGSDMGNLSLDVYSEGIWHLNHWKRIGEQHPSNNSYWSKQTVDLTSYNGPTKIRFRGVTVGGYRGDMAIDQIEIQSGIAPNTSVKEAYWGWDDTWVYMSWLPIPGEENYVQFIIGIDANGTKKWLYKYGPGATNRGDYRYRHYHRDEICNAFGTGTFVLQTQLWPGFDSSRAEFVYNLGSITCAAN
ncbi:MAG: subtilisin family serine protease [Flavobacteriales bacterium]|jgi:subtilisin family serine protease